jgi:hypothetical protein
MPYLAFFPPAGGVWGGMRAGFWIFPFSLPNFVPVENWRAYKAKLLTINFILGW